MTLVDTRPAVTDTAAALYVVASNAHRLAAQELAEGSGVAALRAMLDLLLPDTDPVQAGLMLLAIGTDLDFAEDLLRTTPAEIADKLAGMDVVVSDLGRAWLAYIREAEIARGQAMTTAIDVVRADRKLS